MGDEFVFDELGEATAGDSGVLDTSEPSPGLLHVYQPGETTVVGFGGVDVPDQVSIAGYREQLYALVEQHKCNTIAFDLTGVRSMPSGLMGLLVSLRNRGLNIELFNSSEDVRDVLQVAGLDRLFDLRDTRDLRETSPLRGE